LLLELHGGAVTEPAELPLRDELLQLLLVDLELLQHVLERHVLGHDTLGCRAREPLNSARRPSRSSALSPRALLRLLLAAARRRVRRLTRLVALLLRLLEDLAHRRRLRVLAPRVLVVEEVVGDVAREDEVQPPRVRLVEADLRRGLLGRVEHPDHVLAALLT